jgi:hypothetical protein
MQIGAQQRKNGSDRRTVGVVKRRRKKQHDRNLPLCLEPKFAFHPVNPSTWSEYFGLTIFSKTAESQKSTLPDTYASSNVLDGTFRFQHKAFASLIS